MVSLKGSSTLPPNSLFGATAGEDGSTELGGVLRELRDGGAGAGVGVTVGYDRLLDEPLELDRWLRCEEWLECERCCASWKCCWAANLSMAASTESAEPSWLTDWAIARCSDAGMGMIPAVARLAIKKRRTLIVLRTTTELRRQSTFLDANRKSLNNSTSDGSCRRQVRNASSSLKLKRLHSAEILPEDGKEEC